MTDTRDWGAFGVAVDTPEEAREELRNADKRLTDALRPGAALDSAIKQRAR